jgi:hypothetical protein
MTKRVNLKVGAVALVALVGAAGFLLAASGDDSEDPITGDALAACSDAALDHTGGGSVTDTEVGDEESYYEVEVTLGDGSQTDVQLDKDCDVVGSEADGDEDEGEGDDD